MWRRLNPKDRQLDSGAGSASLVETTNDQSFLRDPIEVANGDFSISSRPAFGRKGTADVLKGLPAVPFNELHITGIDTRPQSEALTASSIYSQSSPEMGNTTPTNDHPLRSSSLYPNDVSPPGSPQIHDRSHLSNGRDSSDVSPISDTVDSSVVPRSPISTIGKFNSNLPVPKKTRKFWNRPSIGSPEQGASTTLWDVYSGEPTTSEKGKPPSTTPSAVKLHEDPGPARYGVSTHISAGKPTSGNTIGRKRVASRDLNSTPIVRPEWRGAGGRHKIVNPLIDKPLPPGMAPSFPAGSEKHQQEQRERERLLEKQTSRNSSNTRRNSQATQPSQPTETLAETVFNPHVASPTGSGGTSPGNRTPPASIPEFPNQEPTSDKNIVRTSLGCGTTEEIVMNRRLQALPDLPQKHVTEENPNGVNIANDQCSQPTPSSLPNTLPGTTSEEPEGREELERDSEQIEGDFRADLHHMRLEEEPRSRFSATTYATTTYDSPPATPEIGIGSSPMSRTPDSILNRKRPVAPAGFPSSRVIVRKAISRTQLPPLPPPSPPPPSESRRKALPKSPPEVNAVSRVAALQAKVDNLKRRKGNLQTVIHELTHVVQPSSIAYDMASRQEIKKTVEGLHTELADVIKDEHETGLKLHRAKKRDDEFSAYEPTSIWVRRVTS